MRPAPIPFVLALAWGLNWPAVKIVLRAVPPFTFRWIGLAGGALTIAAFNFCTAFAQLNTSTSRAAVLTYTMPMMSAALAWWFLGERRWWCCGAGRAALASGNHETCTG